MKPKEDSWNANPVGGGGGGGGQWNSGRPQEGGGGWGAPPPTKPSGGGWSGGGQPGREQPWHHSESPTIGRRFDDGGGFSVTIDYLAQIHDIKMFPTF